MIALLRPLFCIVVWAGALTCFIADTATASQLAAAEDLRFAFIYFNDGESAGSFQELLEGHALHADLVPLDDVPTTDFAGYAAIIVGSDIQEAWSTSAVKKITDTKLPVLGLGEGGYYFFGKLGLAIGSPQGWHGGDVAVRAIRSSDSNFWSLPNGGLQEEDELVLYSETGHVGIHLPQPASGVLLIGQESRSTSHYPIVEQNRRYVLWGFTGSPEKMTSLGKRLFIHTCRYVALVAAEENEIPERSLIVPAAAAKPKTQLPRGNVASRTTRLLTGGDPLAELSDRVRSLEDRVAELESAWQPRASEQFLDNRVGRAASPLAGTWLNVAGRTRGIPKFVIAEANARWTIRAWGACIPTDCDWGTTRLNLLGDSISSKSFPYGFARWDHGFKETYITVRIENSQLVAELYGIYKDYSGRSNTRRIARFERDEAATDSCSTELAVFLGCGEVGGPGTIEQVTLAGEVASTVPLFHPPSGLVNRGDSLVATVATPYVGGGQTLAVRSNGAVDHLALKERFPAPISIALDRQSQDLLIADNEQNTVTRVLSQQPGNAELLFRAPLEADHKHFPSMSVAAVSDGHVVFTASDPRGVFRLPLQSNASLSEPLLSGYGAVAADPTSNQWVAMVGSELKVFEGEEEQRSIPCPAGAMFWRYHVMDFAPDGRLFVVLRTGKGFEIQSVDLDGGKFSPHFVWNGAKIRSMAVGPRMDWKQ